MNFVSIDEYCLLFIIIVIEENFQRFDKDSERIYPNEYTKKEYLCTDIHR